MRYMITRSVSKRRRLRHKLESPSKLSSSLAEMFPYLKGALLCNPFQAAQDLIAIALACDTLWLFMAFPLFSRLLAPPHAGQP